MKQTASLLLTLSLALNVTAAPSSPAPRAARSEALVVIVGGGIGGLATMDALDSQGIQNVLLLESEGRVGGRMWTERNTGDGNAYYERGAELVNTTDRGLRKLLDKYQVGLVERHAIRIEAEDSFLFQERRKVGNRYELGALKKFNFAQLLELMNEIPEDRKVLETFMQIQENRRSKDPAVRKTTLQKLRSITANELVKEGNVTKALFNALISSEFGAGIEVMTAEVLFDYAEVKTITEGQTPRFDIELIPGADEKFRVAGGTDSIVLKLKEKYQKRIRTQTRVTKIYELAPNSFDVTIANDKGQVSVVHAEHVVFAAPSHTLNSIKIDSPSIKASELAEAARLPFASNAKIFLRFSERFWERLGSEFAGVGILESGLQLWDTSEDQAKKGGVITLYPGDWPTDEKEHQEKLAQVLAELRQHPAFKNMGQYLIGVDKQVWKQSYAGVFTPEYPRAPRLFTHDLPTNIYFVGSDKDVLSDRQISASLGYMDGAVRTANKAAARILRHNKSPQRPGLCERLFMNAG